MPRRNLLALYDRQMRIETQPDAGFTVERHGSVVRLVGPSAAAHDNCVIYSNLGPADAEAAILDEMAAFGRRRRAFEWKVFAHDGPPDLATRLLTHGFVAEDRETVLIRDLSADQPSARTAPGIDLCTVDDPDRLPVVTAVQTQVWGDDHAWLQDALAAEMAAGPDAIEILIAACPGIGAVATSWMRLHRGTSFASIWGAATLPAFRCRGIYSMLVERHAATARKRGAALMTVDANVNSRPILERLGFERLAEAQGFVWRPPPSAAGA